MPGKLGTAPSACGGPSSEQQSCRGIPPHVSSRASAPHVLLRHFLIGLPACVQLVNQAGRSSMDICNSIAEANCTASQAHINSMVSAAL